jgi:hypothetical protein
MSSTTARRLRWLALAAIVLLALALRLWRIDSLPPGFHFDESFEGLEAWRILTDPAYRPVFLTGNFGVAPLNAYANALTFGLFQLFGGEAGPTAMRVTAAAIGVFGVLAVFALGTELRELDPKRLTLAFPLLAAAVLGTLRWHIHFSRMGIEPIYVPLLWAAAAWLLLRGWRLQAWGSLAACGLLLALAMYTYQGAWIIPFLMIPVVLHLWLADRYPPAAEPPARVPGTPPAGNLAASDLAEGNPLAASRSGSSPATARVRRLWGPLLAAGVALLLVLPLAWFFLNHPDLLILRPAQIAVTGDAAAVAAATPLQNTVATALMFVPAGLTGDMDPRRNLPGEAALNWWQFVPFAAGFLLALWRIRNPAYTTLLTGLVGLLLPGIFSEYAPHFHRILGAAAPVALLAALGLDAVIRLGARAAQQQGRRWPLGLAGILAAAVILAGGVVAARDYFVRWAALPDLFHAFDAGLWQIGQELAARPPGDVIYLTPRTAGHPTLAFALATSNAAPAPISFDGRHVFPLTAGVNPTPETYIVINHEDFRTPLLLPEVLPAAQVAATVPDPGGAPYAIFYVRPGGTAAARPPQTTVDITLDDGTLALQGYDVQPAPLRRGEVLYLQLHWLVNRAPEGDWTVFTHLLREGEDGSFVQVAGRDSPPGAGSLPTSRWQAGWRVLDEYQIALPADLAPGTYTLAVGLYQPDGARLPAAGPGILLGEVVIE